MTALEQAILRAAIQQAGSISQGQIAEVLIGLLLADQPTRDAFIKQAAQTSLVVVQDQLSKVDQEAADRKAALQADIAVLDTTKDAVVDPATPVVGG